MSAHLHPLNLREVIFVFLFGPTSVAKGWLTDLFRQSGHRTVGIGDITRHKLENDAEFIEKWGPTVSAGHLLPDHVAMQLFMEGMSAHKGGHTQPEVIVDGLGRSPGQVEQMVEAGILDSSSTFFIINAMRSTCQRRADERALRLKKPRTDAGKFSDRYKLHQNSIPGIQGALARNNLRCLQVNADCEAGQDADFIPNTLFLNVRSMVYARRAAHASPERHMIQHHGTVPEALLSAR